MNVGIFTNAYKPIINGVVNCIDLIRQGLTKRGHNVYIFAPFFPGYEEEDEGVFRFPSLNLTKKIKFPIAIPFSGKIRKLIPMLNLDIIHSHHPFLLGETGAQYSRKLHIPLIFSFHTQYEQYSHYIPLPQGLVKKVSKFSVTQYTKKCSFIITPGTSIIELLHSYGIKDNVIHINNAIDLSSFESPDRVKVRSKYSIGKNEKLLIYVGRMALEKNLAFMLEAFKIVLTSYKAWLMIIGEGAELDNLKALALKLGISERVIFPGRIEYREIPSYYGASDIFIMTSTTEVKPLALLEAMASGLPIVAVSAHGASDTIIDGENGYLTEENREKFAEKVLSLLKNEKLLTSMRENSKRIAKGYSIDATTEQLIEIYRKAIEKVNSKML